MLSHRDSNLNKHDQNVLCYHYTMGQSLEKTFISKGYANLKLCIQFSKKILQFFIYKKSARVIFSLLPICFTIDYFFMLLRLIYTFFTRSVASLFNCFLRRFCSSFSSALYCSWYSFKKSSKTSLEKFPITLAMSLGI